MTKQKTISDRFLKLTKKYDVESGKTSLYPSPSGVIHLREPESDDVVKVKYDTFEPEDGRKAPVPYVEVSIRNKYGNMTTSQFDGDPAQAMIDKIQEWMLDSQIEALKD